MFGFLFLRRLVDYYNFSYGETLKTNLHIIDHLAKITCKFCINSLLSGYNSQSSEMVVSLKIR